jgi:hypothetical protein
MVDVVGDAHRRGNVLRERSNAFYTPGALLGGLIVLLALYVGGDVLRHVLLRDEANADADAVAARIPELAVIEGLERLPPNEIRVVRTSHSAASPERSTGREAGTPVAMADRLAQGGTYLFIGFWVLVSFGHLHYASASLLLTGLLLGIRCVLLLPAVLAGRGPGEDRALRVRMKA